MLSLYNIIKNGSVSDDGEKEIVTEYEFKCEKEEIDETEEKKELAEKNAKDFIQSYEVLARTMVENSRKQSEELLDKTYKDVKNIQKEAYEKGYAEGHLQGEKDGYEEGTTRGNAYYEDMKNKAFSEVETLTSNAENLLHDCKKQYEKYLEDKQEEIKQLIMNITESVLKKEIKEKDAIGNMIVEALENAKKSKNIIIKCRENYVENTKEKIEEWKTQSVFKGEIFVVSDENLEEGVAVIERENGKIMIDANIALDKVKEIILEF